MTDVVGSTALWEVTRAGDARGAGAARRDRARCGGCRWRAGLQAHRRRDDRRFDDAEPAIAAARAACDGLTTESWPIPGEIRIRSSLHAGTATERDGDFFGPVAEPRRTDQRGGPPRPDRRVGPGVHRRLAEPTGIDLGEHQLRDLGEPVRLWQFDDGSHPPLRSMLRRAEQPAGAADRVYRARGRGRSDSIAPRRSSAGDDQRDGRLRQDPDRCSKSPPR